MKVSDVIKKLQKMPPEGDVIVWDGKISGQFLWPIIVRKLFYDGDKKQLIDGFGGVEGEKSEEFCKPLIVIEV